MVKCFLSSVSYDPSEIILKLHLDQIRFFFFFAHMWLRSVFSHGSAKGIWYF